MDSTCTTDSDVTFTSHWKSVYDPAVQLSLRQNSSPAQNQRVSSMLDGMTKIVFGLEESQKAICTEYGDGCLELAVALVQSTFSKDDSLQNDEHGKVMQDAVWKSAIKFIKAVVIRNKMGRARCRTVGIFDLLDTAMQRFLTYTPSVSAPLVDEALTTLAAICLSDDLNALQAAIQLRHVVDRASVKYSWDRVRVRVTYLTTLFDLIEQQESKLFGMENFIDSLQTAELELRRGKKEERSQKLKQAQQHYTTALGAITEASQVTHLLDNLTNELHQCNACIKLELGDWLGALEDANHIKGQDDAVARIRSKALEELGQRDEALSKAIAANPNDDALRAQLERLSVENEDDA